MKHITETISPRFSTLARLGVAGVCLGTAALTGLAQSSSSKSTNTTGSTTAQQRASDRAADRASDRSALRRDSNEMNSGFSRQDRKFIEKFTEASQRELALAQLGAERATNPDVKAYAQKLVQEHAAMHRDFMTVASGGTLSASGSLAAATTERAGSTSAATTGTATTDRSGALGAPTGSMATASATDGKQDRHVRKLMEKKAGEDFDEAFVERMIEEHKDGVDMLEDIVEDEDRNPQIRAFANKHLPIMREHLNRAKQLEDAVD